MTGPGFGQTSLFPPEPASDPLLCWLWLANTLGAGSIYSPNSAGTNALLREGRAKAVCKPGDLFGVLGLRGAAAPAAVRSAPDPMSETERRVLACIGPKAKGVEELGAASGLPTGLLLGTLMKLELAGRVTCLPGKRYILR